MTPFESNFLVPNATFFVELIVLAAVTLAVVAMIVCLVIALDRKSTRD